MNINVIKVILRSLKLPCIMLRIRKVIIKKAAGNFLTLFGRRSKIPKTREVSTPPIREIKPISDSFKCPYCFSQKFVRRGWRQKKRERVQLYLCLDCHKTFTQQITKGKHYPLEVMLDAVSIYNLGYSLEETCRIINQKYNDYNGYKSYTAVAKAPLYNTSHYKAMSAATLANWLSETEELCRFARMREYALKKYQPRDMVLHATLAHRQLYRYRFHQAKCRLIIQEEFQHRRFAPLQEFLEMVPGECPHQYFQEGLRASEAPLTFSKKQMIVRAKQNYATRLCEFVLQSVKERRLRHEALQKFMLCNDSVTVATEVPVYITRDDLLHMQSQLGFEIYKAVKTPRRWPKDSSEVEGTDCETVANSSTVRGVSGFAGATSEVSLGDLPKLITGHIDILQIRNGQAHILDYKPGAEKERPIEQLTLYAMALSRLTGLRLFEFKCAWFDEKDYFEFYPLHVLHKPGRTSRRRKVYTMEGIYKINRDEKKMEEIRPHGRI